MKTRVACLAGFVAVRHGCCEVVDGLCFLSAVLVVFDVVFVTVVSGSGIVVEREAQSAGSFSESFVMTV